MVLVGYGGDRVEGTINLGITAKSWRPEGSYGFPIYVDVYCNGKLIHTHTSATGGNIDETFYTSVKTNDAAIISVQYRCGQNPCKKTTYGLTNNSISFGSYNPDVPPKGPNYCKLSETTMKPDQSISVSWKGESGGTYGINHFQMEISQWRGTTQIRSYTRISGPIYYKTHGSNPCTWTGTLTSLTNYDDNKDKIQIRPGDKIQFHVACYTKSGYEGWFSTVDATSSGASDGAKDVSIYKDGIIYYKDLKRNFT